MIFETSNEEELFVVSPDGEQIPGQLRYGYKGKFAEEMRIIAEAVRIWGYMLAISELNECGDALKCTWPSFICCLAWAKATGLISSVNADEILECHFSINRDREFGMPGLNYDADLYQAQFEADLAAFRYRLEEDELFKSRIRVIEALIERLGWHCDAQMNRSQEYLLRKAAFEDLYDRLKHQRVLRDLSSDES